MFCKNCGQQLADGAAFCPNCGAAVTAPDQAAQPTGTQPITGQNNQTSQLPYTGVDQNKHLKVLKIISIVLFLLNAFNFFSLIGLVFSILGFVFSAKGKVFFDNGNYSAAEEKNKISKIMLIISIVIYILLFMAVVFALINSAVSEFQ